MISQKTLIILTIIGAACVVVGFFLGVRADYKDCYFWLFHVAMVLVYARLFGDIIDE